ncbi:MAG: hypothetical protein DME40_18415 [Verrucomicrobia bacterium]|nr:MAG: hypothetical protein DME40_18415 [Verrucomicrobiota bacterium]
MDLMRIEAPDFDLAMTLNSGQVFHWEKYGAGFCGTIGEHAVYVEKRGEVLQIKMEGGALRRHGQHQVLQNVPRPTTAATAGSRELAPPSAARVVAHYFALDHALEEICASFSRDQAAIWGKETNRRRRNLFISVIRASGANERERITKMRARVSREKPAGNGEACRVRGSGSGFVERAL